MQVTLNIPALFAAFSEIDANAIDELNLEALKKILSRSKRQDATSTNFEAWLYRQFIGQECSEKQIPFASLTASLDGLDGDSGLWMRADPVFLYPDTHSLILQDPSALRLTMEEAKDIVQLLAPYFEDYGAELIAPNAQRWYLRFKETSPELQCTPLHEALMQPVNELLPTGHDKRQWHTLFNEMQMLLNQSPVNQIRESNGLPPVNSLWFWGNGTLPQATAAAYNCCIGGDSFVEALCQHSSNLHSALPSDMTVSRYHGSALVLDDRLLKAHRLNDPVVWLAALQQCETEVVSPLLQQLKDGNIKSIKLMTDSDVQYECSHLMMRAFWKRTRPLSHFLLNS